MAKLPQEIRDEAPLLPPDARALLADSLLARLDSESVETIDEEWDREIRKRIEELDSGTAKPIPWAEARQRLLRRFAASTEDQK